MKLRLIALLTSFLLAPLAWAASADKPYSIEVTGGWSSLSFDDKAFVANGLPVTSVKKNSQAFGIGGAYQIDEMWSVDASYNISGYMTVRGTTTAGDWRANIKVASWNVGTTATFSLADKIGANLKIGIVSADDQFAKTFNVKNLLPDQQSSTNYYVGGGIQYAASERISLSLTVVYNHQEQRATTVSGGFRWKF